ncbi:MAG: arginine deiminase family protein [Candidatus Micrarchaeota archaeon]
MQAKPIVVTGKHKKAGEYSSLRINAASAIADLSNYKPLVTSEYGEAKVVVVCKPVHFGWKTPINEMEAKNPQPNVAIAIKQHEQMTHVLGEYNVKVVEVPYSPERPEAVYTRDPIAVVDDKLIKSRMRELVRSSEPETIYFPLGVELPKEVVLEGGDVILGPESKLFLGCGPRTCKEAKIEIGKLVSRDIIEIELKDNSLHADCVFNVLSSSAAIVYPGGFRDPKVAIDFAKKHFPHVLVINNSEFINMGTNFFMINPETVLSSDANPRIAEELKRMHFNVIQIPFSEMHLGMGSIRCCIAPIVRENTS